MAQWVNFKIIKEQVSIEQILEHYGLLQHATRKGHEIRIRCPFHEDAQPSCTANTEKNGFHCFGCRAKGNIFGFMRLKESIDSGDRNQDDRQAALLIAEWFGIASERPSRQHHTQDTDTTTTQAAEKTQAPETPAVTVTQPPEEQVNPPLQFAFKKLDERHPYLAERRLTQETIAHFVVGHHAGRGIMSGRVVIPIHNAQGELVAYAGRWPADEGWPEGEGKYKLPPAFKKSHVLFNLHRALKSGTGTSVIVTEGFFDVMKIHQAGFPNVVSLIGAALDPVQEALLVEHFDTITLLFDEDKAGRVGRDEALVRLSRKMYVKVIELGTDGMQPDRLSEEDIRKVLGLP